MHRLEPCTQFRSSGLCRSSQGAQTKKRLFSSKHISSLKSHHLFSSVLVPVGPHSHSFGCRRRRRRRRRRHHRRCRRRHRLPEKEEKSEPKDELATLLQLLIMRGRLLWFETLALRCAFLQGCSQLRHSKKFLSIRLFLRRDSS